MVDEHREPQLVAEPDGGVDHRVVAPAQGLL
jgi:hypothetical protein